MITLEKYVNVKQFSPTEYQRKAVIGNHNVISLILKTDTAFILLLYYTLLAFLIMSTDCLVNSHARCAHASVKRETRVNTPKCIVILMYAYVRTT